MIRLNVHPVIDDDLTTIGAVAVRQDTPSGDVYITVCVSGLMSARAQTAAVLNLLTDNEYDALVTQGAFGLDLAVA